MKRGGGLSSKRESAAVYIAIEVFADCVEEFIRGHDTYRDETTVRPTSAVELRCKGVLEDVPFLFFLFFFPHREERGSRVKRK